MSKPLKAKPQFYSVCYEALKAIARDMGYNLVIHGSMDRDLDLIAIAWENHPNSHMELIRAFCDYLGVPKLNAAEHYMHSVLPGGRDSYVINLNRGPKDSYEDSQYYLDISFTPLIRIK